MNASESKRFDDLYERHLKLLKLQGKSISTIDCYSRAVRRIGHHFDCCPERLTVEQRQNYFSDLVESHSWSTVKIDRLGLMFYWKHVLKQDWQWLDIVKPPKIKSIPDILTPKEISKLTCTANKLRCHVSTSYQ
ncbi:MAG: phage integrase N-terminal SAM-like domain-containing protein [Desulfotalea sp.]